MSVAGAPRVVIAGGGFGGLYAAMYLAQADFPGGSPDVALVSRTNYFTFTPLLAEVVGGSLGPEHVTLAYRVLARRRGFRFVEATVQGLEPERASLRTTAGEIRYDYLITGLGAVPMFFGNEEIERAARPLSTVGDATDLHDRIVRKAEEAVRADRAGERRRKLTFVVAGAGPAGVEAAGEIWSFLAHALPRYYGIEASPRVVIVEGGDTILRGWDDELAEAGVVELRRRGIEVRLGTRVRGFADGVVDAVDRSGADRATEADTLVWTAGTRPATDALDGDGAPVGERGHLPADRHLRVEGLENVFAVGDVASVENPRTGRPYPPVAPIAISQGIRAAGNVENAIAGRPMEEYRAHHAGKIVSLGGGVALVDVLGWKIRGPLAWAIYRSAYLLKLVGAKNKIRAGITLLLDRFFERDLTGA